MNKDLSDCIARATKLVEVPVAWRNGTMPLELTYYLGDLLPPVEYASSVRAVVLRDVSVMVVTDHSGQVYVLPGGRAEKGESSIETLRREILEETGWTVSVTRSLGFMHFHHLAARPAGYQYPYPDFVWPVFVAQARDFVPEAIQPDDYVSKCEFLPVEEVKKLPLNKGELMLLEAALGPRGPHTDS